MRLQRELLGTPNKLAVTLSALVPYLHHFTLGERVFDVIVEGFVRRIQGIALICGFGRMVFMTQPSLYRSPGWALLILEQLKSAGGGRLNSYVVRPALLVLVVPAKNLHRVSVPIPSPMSFFSVEKVFASDFYECNRRLTASDQTDSAGA